jgi:cell wall-associated NlpC family hydrolase
MFVSYCFDQAKLGSLVAGAQSPKGFAYCPAAVAHFTKTNQIVPVKQAQPGDIVFFNWDGGKDAEHVGLVVSNDTTHGILDTYEGNTGAPGKNQSNGDGCYEKRRLYQFVVAVVRPKYTA